MNTGFPTGERAYINNPLSAELFWGNMEIYQHFYNFFDTEIKQVDIEGLM